MPEKIVRSGLLRIWTESFGDPNDPAVLLIAGASAQAVFWADEFCCQLVAGGRFVIRYDSRDTGLSDSVDFAESPYTVNDLAADAVSVLDAYDIPEAHAVGVSGGGLICQALALDHRDRVITVSALLSSLLGTGSIDNPNGGYGDLPSPSPAFLEKLSEFFGKIPADRKSFIEWSLKKYRLISGSLEPFDQKAGTVQAGLEFDRARNLSSMNNHALAFAASPKPKRFSRRRPPPTASRWRSSPSPRTRDTRAWRSARRGTRRRRWRWRCGARLKKRRLQTPALFARASRRREKSPTRARG